MVLWTDVLNFDVGPAIKHAMAWHSYLRPTLEPPSSVCHINTDTNT
jgi:hypothetical protein